MYKRQLLGFCADCAKRMSDLYLDAGMDVIAVVDPLVSQISSDHFEEFLSAPYTELFRYCLLYTSVWKWMFDAYNGIFNWALKSLGVIDQNIMWLGDARFAIWCIILILFTTSVGQPIVLYVAALGNVDRSLVEAAEVDGATKLQTFWKIKWPSVMPTPLYVAIITPINSFQCFALIQLLTSGGPQHSTDTVMYYLYTCLLYTSRCV